ncbi:MAG: HEAT repeat domain-containing protein [Cyanobacteria bacterium J06631_9]
MVQASEAQTRVDNLIDYVNEQIELLAFDEPDLHLIAQLVESLSDPRQATRLSLIESLTEVGESATPALLAGLSNHPEAIVRRGCCNALTNIGDEAAVSGLVNALLQDDDIGVKSAAAGALAKIGAPAFDAVYQVLAAEDVSESCKGHAAWAMASMSEEVSDQLYGLVMDPSATVRTAVVGAIAQLAQRQLAQKRAVGTQSKALPRLISALSDPAADVRIEAAANLSRLDCQIAFQPLIVCLKDPVADVRKAATLALGKLGNSAAIDAIAPLTQDPDANVQRVASLTIQQLEAITP